MRRSIILLLVFIQCLDMSHFVVSEMCPRLYPKLCPAKRNHILCFSNLKSSSVQQADKNIILKYSNNFARNRICNQINNVKVNLVVEYELTIMASKALSHNVLHNADVCFATELNPNVRVIHNDFTSIMNVRAMGCAKSTTENDLLCVFSNDESFMNFQNYDVNSNRYCGLDYNKLSSRICYLHNATSIAIVNQLKNSKRIQWDWELEYLAQGSIATNTTNFCYTKDQKQIQLSTIHYHLDEINNFDLTTILEHMIRNGVFDVLENSKKYRIGCTFYDLQTRSLRMLCVFDTISGIGNVLDLITDCHIYLKTMGYQNTYTVYGLTILVYFNILIVLLCMRITCKFLSKSVDEIYGIYN